MAKNAVGSRSRSKSAAKAVESSAHSRLLVVHRACWVAAVGAWIFLLLSLASFDSADAPSHVVAIHNSPAANLCGKTGAIVAYWSYYVLGIGVWAAMACGAWFLSVTLTGHRVHQPYLRLVGVTMLIVAVSSLHALWWPNTGPLVGARAGLVGEQVAAELLPRFGGTGTSLILLVALCVGAMVAIEEFVAAIPRATVIALGLAKHVRMPRMPALPGIGHGRRVAMAGAPLTASEPAGAPARGRKRKGSALSASTLDEDNMIDPDAGGLGATESFDPDADSSRPAKAIAFGAARDDDDDSDAKGSEEEKPAAQRPRLTADQLREKIAKLPLRMASAARKVAKDEDIPRQDNFEGYKFPTLDLLDNPDGNFSEKLEEYVRNQAQLLQDAMRTYGIEGEVVGIESGPVVTLYSVQLAPGTKVAKVTAVSSDIARSLGAQNIRIVANTAGKTTVGIEVPNLRKEKVRLKELMSGGHAEGMNLPMFLGKDASGEPLVVDLTRMPHMLIAGTTGSGKSVCMNTVIMGWLYTKRPDELKLVLVDPKMVEMSQFTDIPHLMCPVVTEMGKAAAILQWAVTKMEERYELFREAAVRDIASYNALTDEQKFEIFKPTSDLERAKIPKKLPYMVFIIDELADLMLTNREVEHFIVRIAQKARAVGIHLILATQRPQANVVTGLIKSNMPCRVSFKVASGMDSRIVLDQKGAELLLGQGDMLVLTPQSSELRRAQGTLVTDVEARKVVNFLGTVAAPSFERSLITIRAGATDENDGGVPGPHERDPLFDEAVRIMIESGRGSVSLLQRRLAIGYSRASRLVDQMGQAGILGEHKGSVAREVVITLEEWEEMKRLEAEQGGTGLSKSDREHVENLGETTFDNDSGRKPQIETFNDEESDTGVPAEFEGEYRR